MMTTICVILHMLYRYRRASDPGAPSEVKIERFHLTSVLYSRFATVTIKSEVTSTGTDGSEEITFRVQVPETAFLSNFSMLVDGQMFLAEVSLLSSQVKVGHYYFRLCSSIHAFVHQAGTQIFPFKLFPSRKYFLVKLLLCLSLTTWQCTTNCKGVCVMRLKCQHGETFIDPMACSHMQIGLAWDFVVPR
jgi:hypothetical protein